MIKTLGILVFVYVCYSLLSGTVYAKSGISGRSYSRRESPTSFWTTIVCYALLSAALILVF